MLLVVILVFAVCGTFIRADHCKLAGGALLFAFAIELGQYFELVRVLGLERNRLARTVIGMTFDVRDLLAYVLGIALVCGLGACMRRGCGEAGRAGGSDSWLDGWGWRGRADQLGRER